MSETIFILGAGASVQAGAPTMATFLDIAEKIFECSSEFRSDYELVRKGNASLQQVHSKANIPFENIESIFSAFEMAQLFDKLGNLTLVEIKNLPKAIKNVISRTIECSVEFPYRDKIQVEPPKPYSQFIKLIEDIGIEKVSILTFNYDLCLDFAAYNKGYDVDYFLDSKLGRSNNCVKLFKLHGSINWVKCSGCEQVVAWYPKDFFSKLTITPSTNENKKNGTLRYTITSHFNKFIHCKNIPAEEIVLVPPTWSKSRYYESLKKVWVSAASELAEARNIFICGYSNPKTDLFFQYLYGLGTVGDSLIKRFYVFDPDKKVEDNYISLLGTGVKSKFKFFDKKFEQAIPEISKIMCDR